jgi:hypothetical protein
MFIYIIDIIVIVYIFSIHLFVILCYHFRAMRSGALRIRSPRQRR